MSLRVEPILPLLLGGDTDLPAMSLGPAVIDNGQGEADDDDARDDQQDHGFTVGSAPGQCNGADGQLSRYTRRALPEPIISATRTASAADQAPSATKAPVTAAMSRRNAAAPR